MATKRELRERWTDELLESALAQLRSGRAPDAFGRTENGLWDLRGFVIRGILRNLSMNAVDLTFCSTERGGQFLGCTLDNVDLSNATLKTNIDGMFSGCRFEASNLSRALFRGSFANCCFCRAKLNDAAGESVAFRECRFDSADFRGAHLCVCTFDACTWRNATFGNGSFYRSKFTEHQPNDVGNTIMDRAEFLARPGSAG